MNDTPDVLCVSMKLNAAVAQDVQALLELLYEELDLTE